MNEEIKKDMPEPKPEPANGQDITPDSQSQDIEQQAVKKKKSFFSRSPKSESPKSEPKQPEDESEGSMDEEPAGEQIDPLNDLEQKLAEANDKFLRLFSDFDNFRKRTAREKLEMSKTASSDLIVQLIPVIDDFERALKSMEIQDESVLPIRQGVELIYNKFWQIMERQGVKLIDAVGQPFDTDFHEALTNIPVPDNSMKGKVVEQVEKGYMLGDKVIRFAKVVVGA